MSKLDVIRSLRRALAALRDADGAAAMYDIVQGLAAEMQPQVVWAPADAPMPESSQYELPWSAEMAGWA